MSHHITLNELNYIPHRLHLDVQGILFLQQNQRLFHYTKTLSHRIHQKQTDCRQENNVQFERNEYALALSSYINDM